MNELPRDDFGWPIRVVDHVRMCAREGCEDDEYRIDGYCSIACRDSDEAEIEKRAVEDAFAAYRADVEPVLRAVEAALEKNPPATAVDYLTMYNLEEAVANCRALKEME